MLNGLDPIIIFQFKKLTPSAEEALQKIPVVSSIVNKIGLPPVPLYLSEQFTGLYIDSEEKNIDIETTTESLSNGAEPKTIQKAIGSTVRVNMKAKSGSIGFTLLSALADLILPKVTSQEYAITYLHGTTTIFEGLLHSYSVQQSADSDLLLITMELSKTTALTPPVQKSVEVSATIGTETLKGGEVIQPTIPTTPPLKGPSPVGPSAPKPTAPVTLPRIG